MLPLAYLRPCVWAIAQLVRRYRVSAVLCTATQPALTPIFREFAPELPVTELCPAGAIPVGRVPAGDLPAGGAAWPTRNWPAGFKGAGAGLMCIVNSRKAAQEVFQPAGGRGALPPLHPHVPRPPPGPAGGDPPAAAGGAPLPGGVHLPDRGGGWMWTSPPSTGRRPDLDSILQAAGRCNREGKRPNGATASSPCSGERAARRPSSPPRSGAGREAMARYADIAAPAAVHAYFTSLLDLKGEAGPGRDSVSSP